MINKQLVKKLLIINYQLSIKLFADIKKRCIFALAIREKFIIVFGRLAQLVQSTSFTPRGSGVRTPHRPQKLQHPCWSFFIKKLLFYIFYWSMV
jgi:hypothetical protein